MLPNGFTYVDDPRLILSLDYASNHNFVGRIVKGYEGVVNSKVCILSKEAATALIAVQNELELLHPGYRLKIFDAYRPQHAVDDFVQWAKESDESTRTIFYPKFKKSELFELGYLAEKSSHSRGSTIDLTICKMNEDLNPSYTELEMGSIFDYFDETAHTLNPNISGAAKENRMLLKMLMEKQGFENYPLEWWHFTLKNEPFPNTYYDFPLG